MPGRLQNKVALVTGAGCIGPGWGNGRATAVLFAREGAKVFAVDKNGESMKETLDRVAEFGGTIKTHECDVTQSASVKAMIDACLEAFGRIDVMVNNVGGSAAGGGGYQSHSVAVRSMRAPRWVFSAWWSSHKSSRLAAEVGPPWA